MSYRSVSVKSTVTGLVSWIKYDVVCVTRDAHYSFLSVHCTSFRTPLVTMSGERWLESFLSFKIGTQNCQSRVMSFSDTKYLADILRVNRFFLKGWKCQTGESKLTKSKTGTTKSSLYSISCGVRGNCLPITLRQQCHYSRQRILRTNFTGQKSLKITVLLA